MNQRTKQRLLVRGLILVSLVGATAYSCAAQSQDVLCNEGNGNFQGEFQNSGITVWVGASRNGELATRACEALFNWKKEALTIANNVAQIDLDAFGTDLGLGSPVAAFQMKRSPDDCCMDYRIYSLEKPPRFLRAIRGGSFFSAADTDLDGRVEIWTDDAAAVDGFEGLSLAELDSAPTIVLRFSRGQLLDVSSEFEAYFDREIARLQAGLPPDDLRDFKNSDGRLSANQTLPTERLHHLRQVKARVLAIVWSYLYSGREQQAWRSLAELWPQSDIARSRASILGTRARGIASQVSRISTPPVKRRKHAIIFDALDESSHGKTEVVPPAPILLTRPPLRENEPSGAAETVLNLIIDSAGKVRSAEAAGNFKIDVDLLRATAAWKFIPAFKDGKAVASRSRLSVSLKQ